MMNRTLPTAMILALSFATLTRCGLGLDTKSDPFANGTSPTPSPTPTSYVSYLYAGDSGSDTILMYQINSTTGKLTAAGSGFLSTSSTPQGLGVDPKNRYVYAAMQAADEIRTFALDSKTGVLTDTGLTATGLQALPQNVVVAPDGNFVYVLSSVPGKVTSFAVNPATGQLTGGSFQAGVSNMSGLTLGPAGNFLVVGNTVAANHLFSVASITPASGALGGFTSNSLPIASAVPAVALDPSGKFLFVVDSGNLKLRVESVDGSGNITGEPASTALSGIPVQIAVHPSGKSVYVTDTGTKIVTSYSFNSAVPSLSTLGTVPVNAGCDHIVADPSGDFVYVGCSGSSFIGILKVESDGHLSSINPSFPTGAVVTSMAIARVQTP